MILLNDLLNIHDGFDDEGWLKECKEHIVDTIPGEDVFSILVLARKKINKVCFKYTLYMSFDFS